MTEMINATAEERQALEKRCQANNLMITSDKTYPGDNAVGNK
jgi:hypothetical protein